VEAVTGPLFHPSLTVEFSSDIAAFWKIFDHLIESHLVELFEDTSVLTLYLLALASPAQGFLAGLYGCGISAYVADQTT
jgi:hypothetical protein